MIISCAIYISLICNKKKKFKNKVSIERNPFEMVGIVELNTSSAEEQIKTRHVGKSSTMSNVVIAECESNDKDTLSENSVILIEKLENSAEDNENKFLGHKNCQTPKFQFGNGNSCWSTLVEDSYFENAKEMRVTETADFSAASHENNKDTNKVVKYSDKEIELAGCLENEKRKIENTETLRRMESIMKPKCCILYNSIEIEGVENVKSCAISLRVKSESSYEGKLLHQNDFSPNVQIIHGKDMYLDRRSPNFIDCGAQMDAKETQKDSKEKGRNDDSIEKADTSSDINSIFEYSKNPVVSLLELLKPNQKGLKRVSRTVQHGFAIFKYFCKYFFKIMA